MQPDITQPDITTAAEIISALNAEYILLASANCVRTFMRKSLGYYPGHEAFVVLHAGQRAYYGESVDDAVKVYNSLG